MLQKSRNQKGKKLENFVAKRLSPIFAYAYRRRDSGSGKYRKEDVSLPHHVPLSIECKKHAKKDLRRWWLQTLEGCAKSKMPVLVYELDYQPEPLVVMRFMDLMGLIAGGSKPPENIDINVHVTIPWYEFEQVLWQVYKPGEKKQVLHLSKLSPMRYTG